MSPLAISLIAFACILGGILLGVFIRTNLPEHHLSGESKDALKLGIGMTATLAALVIALLLASAKSISISRPYRQLWLKFRGPSLRRSG